MTNLKDVCEQLSINEYCLVEVINNNLKKAHEVLKMTGQYAAVSLNDNKGYCEVNNNIPNLIADSESIPKLYEYDTLNLDKVKRQMFERIYKSQNNNPFIANFTFSTKNFKFGRRSKRLKSKKFTDYYNEQYPNRDNINNKDHIGHLLCSRLTDKLYFKKFNFTESEKFQMCFPQTAWANNGDGIQFKNRFSQQYFECKIIKYINANKNKYIKVTLLAVLIYHHTSNLQIGINLQCSSKGLNFNVFIPNIKGSQLNVETKTTPT